MASGIITFTTENPVWVLASNLAYSNLGVSEIISFTTENIDTSTLAVEYDTSGIISSASINTNGVSIYVNKNNTDSIRSADITLKGTDTNGDTVSNSITIKQVPYNESPRLSITSDTGISSSNPAVVTDNKLTVEFTADNLNNFYVRDSFNIGAYITNATFTNTSENNYKADITFSDNYSGSTRKGAFKIGGYNTIEDSPLDDRFYSYAIFVEQDTPDGYITIDRDSIIVPASSNYQHQDVKVTYGDLNGDITTTISGDVTGTFEWYDYNNNHYLLFHPNDNATENTLTGTITLTAVDYNGNNLTQSYTVTQKPYNPTFTYIRNDTDFGSFNVLYDENKVINISCKGVSFDAIEISDPSTSTMSFSSFVTSYSTTKVDNDNYKFTINTRINDSHSASNTAYIYPTYISTEFGKNVWESEYNIIGTQRVPIKKCGIAGVLRISPESTSADGTAGSGRFTIYKDSYLTGTVSATHSGDMDITNLTVSNNSLSVSYGANEGTVDKNETITISGKDYQGLLVTSTATIRQKVIYNLDFIETQKSIAQDATTVSFEISDRNVTNLKARGSGSVLITKYEFTDTSNGHLLTLTVSPNGTRVSRSSTITVTASDPYNGTLTTTASLNQAGLDGLLSLDPVTKTIPKTGSSFDIAVATDGIDTSTLRVSTSGDINFGFLSWNGDKTKLTVNYNTNEGSSELTGTITVSGTDYNGNTQSATCTVTQITADSSLRIVPNEQVVNYATSATFTIESEYVTLGNVSFSGDSTYVNSYNLQDNILTLNLRRVDVAGEFTVYVTVSGYDISGSEITDTATLKLQGQDGYFVINPEHIWRVSKNAGSYDFTVNTFGIQSDTINIIDDQSWATVSNNSVSYNAYSGIPTTWDAHRDCVITFSGIDYKGNVIIATRTLRQYALNAEMTINPTRADIEYNGYVDVDVTLVGPAPIPELITSGYADGSTYSWLNEWGEGTTRTNTMRIVPPTNMNNSERSLSYTFKSEPLYVDSTLWRYLTVKQAGKPVTITLDPSESTVNKDAGSIIYNITVDGVSQSSLRYHTSSSDSGMIASATFNSDKTQLTVVYTANPLVANRTATISVYSDELNERVTGEAIITQTGIDPVLSAYDLIIGYHQSSATNLITTKGVGNLSVSFEGDVTISNYYFRETTEGYNLIIETPNNDTTNNYRSIATVTGTVTEGQYEGETRTITFNVVKYGIEAINITPSSRTLDYGENSTTYTVEAINVNNLQVSVSGDSSFVTNKSISNGILTITTIDFSAKVAKTATITVSGAGYTGTISSSAILTKYGPNGTIVASSKTVVFPRSAYTKTVTITAEGITGSITPTYTGTISPSNISLNGSTLSIALNTNTTDGDLTGIITLTGTDYKGNTITETINVIQKPYDSLIQLDPSSKTVDKLAGTTTYTLITESVNLSTANVSYSGPSITSATLLGDTITVTYRENTIVATRNNTITVTATDVYGTSVSATADLFQTGIDPTMTASNINILSTQANATAFVSTNGIGLPATVTFEGNVNITDYSISPTTGGFNINIVTADNLTNNSLRSTATVTGTVTEGQYAGETRTATFIVNKFGLEGTIIIDPETLTVKKAGQIVVFDVSLGNMQNDTVTASTGTFNSDKSKLTVTVGTNSSSSDRTINVTVSGTDNNGNIKSATAVITQYGIDPYINIQPSSKTISYDEAIVNFTITTSKVSGLSVSIDGPIDVTSYTLDGNTLRIVTGDNLSMDWLMDTITITGTSELGETVTATATLSKFGLGGGIIVDNSIVLGSCNSLAVIEYALDKINPDSIYGVFVNDNFLNPTFWIDKDNRKIFFDCGTSGYEEITGTFYLYGTDEDGIPKVATIDMRQLLKLRDEQGHSIYRDLYIINKIRNVGYSAGSESFKLEAENTTLISVTNGGTLNGVWSQNGDTYTVTYPENTSNNALYSYITFTGITSTGETIVNSAMVIQGTNASSGPYVFMLQPASQSVKRIEASANNVYYIINSYKGTENIGYGISGFVLTGIWGAKPTIAFSDGYPYVKVPLNTHKAEREAVVMFLQDGSYNTLTARIIQEEGVEPKVSPIWKDYSNSATTDSFIEYHINLDGDIIYSGKAYKYPDNSKITWSINEAVSNYLGNGIYFTDGIHQIPDYSKDFFMEVNTGDKYIETFYNSWAYKDTDYWLSDPIDFRVDQRQWLPVSFLSTNYDQITVNGIVYAALKENDGWTVMTRLGKYILDCNAGVSVIGADGNRLNYKIASGDYVLYYSNAYGGWDSLLCNGTSRKTDNIEHLNYRRKSANQSQFSKINYQNNITPTWSLNTGINIDGSKMYHLLESTMVYLHNLETNEIIPVVITNSSCDYLNYTNNGKKPYYYTITVEESNQKLRK